MNTHKAEDWQQNRLQKLRQANQQSCKSSTPAQVVLGEPSATLFRARVLRGHTIEKCFSCHTLQTKNVGIPTRNVPTDPTPFHTNFELALVVFRARFEVVGIE